LHRWASSGAFADAFFGAAMRRSDDLPGAFEAARKRLAEQHAAEPVMVVGAAIAEQLKTLRQRGKGRVVASFDALVRCPSTIAVCRTTIPEE
jgi:hypothetical protein